MKKLFIFLVALLVCTNSFAWGRVGHETIAKIAENNMSSRAKKKIEQYLGHSIMYYAKWMDEYRRSKEYGFTNSWHAAPVDTNLYYKADPNGKRIDAVIGLEQAITILKNYKHHSDSTIAVNLKYVIHLVGDMHCPSHIKYSGVNMNYNVKLGDLSRKAETMSIHKVWDSGIISLMRTWSASEWAEELDRLSKSQKRIIINGSPRDWMHDNAIRCKVQFEWTSANQELNQDFLNSSIHLVETQILFAGYRLAAVLDSIF